jgi:hypothetical protein
MRLNFTEQDSERASAEWGANCGPHALAAALWLDLSTVRDLMPDFEDKGYTTPTMMESALKAAGINHTRTTKLRTSELCEGISRIQWEGPWLKPGVPFAAAYHHTHWVAQAGGFVFCTAVPLFGWIPIETWRRVVGVVCQDIKNCTGWHATHHYAFDVLAKGGA